MVEDKTELPDDFDPATYLELNLDVKKSGMDPAHHYLKYGHKERRLYTNIAGKPSNLDSILHSSPKTKRSELGRHHKIWEWIKGNCSQKGLRVLEIGSRSVVSDSVWKKYIPDCDYTGLDVMLGENVTFVGDAHQLSQYFPRESFDLVMAFAVLEHIAMPWVLAEEISKVLAPRGTLVIETHFSFSNHEQPWHFFQFNANGLQNLFCEELGFETLDVGLDTPIVGRFANETPEYLRGRLVKELYCHSSIIARKSYPDRTELWKNGRFEWREVSKRVCTETMYPIESDLLNRQARERQ